MIKKLDTTYDDKLVADKKYIATLPDLEDGVIQGAKVKIQQVGIHNFRLPLTFQKKDGGKVEITTSITGTVSLEGKKKGINMSRIIRSFYDFKDDVLCFDMIEQVLKTYQKELGSFEAKIILNFSYPILQESLRSKLEGFQYYDIALEGRIDREGNFERLVHFDFVYSSACPCSYELGQHAQNERNKAVVSHSQRSIARVSIKCNQVIWFEEIKEMCLDALKTETQVMVKREDEQAFAELNGSYLKFVEDSCRLLYERLDKEEKVLDFKVLCSHMESLHSHDAIGVIVKGVPGGFEAEVEHSTFNHLSIGK